MRSKDATTQLARDAEAAGRRVPTSAVTNQYAPLVDTAANREALGVPGDITEIADRERLFNAAHPSGQIAPTQALTLKREADTLASTAQNQLRRGSVPTDMTAKLHDATRAGLNEGLEGATAGMTSPEGLNYADQNARTSILYGLSRALRAAENRPHGLTDLASIGTGILGGLGVGFDNRDARIGTETGLTAAAIMRVLASPVFQSRAGIGAYAARQVPYQQLLRAAILARLRAGETSGTPETR